MRRFTPDPVVEALMPFVTASTILPIWITFSVLRCYHCGRCISEGDTRSMGCRDCKCDYCPRRPDQHYRRCGLGWSDRIRPRLVKENPINGGIEVVEGFWKFRIKSQIDVPNCRADGKPLDWKHIFYVDEARNFKPEHLKRKEICYQQTRLEVEWSQADLELHPAADPIVWVSWLKFLQSLHKIYEE